MLETQLIPGETLIPWGRREVIHPDIGYASKLFAALPGFLRYRFHFWAKRVGVFRPKVCAHIQYCAELFRKRQSLRALSRWRFSIKMATCLISKWPKMITCRENPITGAGPNQKPMLKRILPKKEASRKRRLITRKSCESVRTPRPDAIPRRKTSRPKREANPKRATRPVEEGGEGEED